MVKVIIVLTNHGDLGTTGNKTGWYLPEVAHPYEKFKEAGFDITFLSPKGGKAPMDPGSGEQFKGDPSCQKFLSLSKVMADIENTKEPSDVENEIGTYDVIFYAGGHGPMWDLPENTEVAKLASAIYERGGIVGAVCHGTVGLIPVKINGEHLIRGKKVTSFTNKEEDAVQLTKAMPFLLETRLIEECGANFVAADNFAVNVQEDKRVVTGQNPASATGVAEKIVALLKSKK